MYAYYAYRAALCALIACGYSRSLRTSIWLLVYRIISVVAEGEIVRHPRRPMSWTKRGTGSCQIVRKSILVDGNPSTAQSVVFILAARDQKY